MVVDENRVTRQADGLKFIAAEHRTRQRNREKVELKALLTFLSFYVLCVGAVYAKTISQSIELTFRIAVMIGFTLLAVFGSWYLYLLNRANNNDRDFAEDAENRLAELIEMRELFFKGDQRERNESKRDKPGEHDKCCGRFQRFIGFCKLYDIWILEVLLLCFATIIAGYLIWGLE